MPPRPRVSSGSQQSPLRPPESQIDVLYNTAVQSFVRRDHIKTQAVLSRLLSHLKTKRSTLPPSAVWYSPEFDIGSDTEEAEALDEWVIKAVKLSISSLTSLYIEPPSAAAQANLPDDIKSIISGTDPEGLLSHLQTICQENIFSEILPPQIVSTLILASLKIRQSAQALNFAHQITEAWITALPDSFIFAISPQSSRHRTKDAKKRKRIESAREGYLKVVELFVGEVLSREGEWEMARGFLDGETVMGSKRKEVLFKHLRSMQSAPSNQSIPAPSPSSSLILPSTRSSRSGSASSASSSSSELTARPNQIQSQLGLNSQSQGPIPARDKGKGRARIQEDSAVVSDESSKLRNNNKAIQNISRDSFPSSSSSGLFDSSKTSTVQQIVNSALLVLPPTMSKQLRAIFGNRLSYLLAIPLPVILVLTFLLRRRRRRNAVTLLPSTGVVNNARDIRARLRLVRARNRGWYDWFLFYLNWWIRKFAGVWKLATTITFM
ncbi:uncharacterized protein I206_104427 [Kwoniella pini CBS 10737]|uniref:Uncharacterized protein n=1 Tax=Kwoniella pini CBS 10737 TaxID=1296096 RepID=A0A1B9I1Z9_9TREE|nr:uncharacterized protein I206_03992 [Kwoniella pini CBS 10737]OCF49471.1 hypothetical protein I206_03992 [Kwoniella pini CBS 10737]